MKLELLTGAFGLTGSIAWAWTFYTEEKYGAVELLEPNFMVRNAELLIASFGVLVCVTFLIQVIRKKEGREASEA